MKDKQMTEELEKQIKYLLSRLENDYYDDGHTKREIEEAIELLSNILDALTL